MQSKESQVFSNTTVQNINSLALSFLYSPILTSIHDHWKVNKPGCGGSWGQVLEPGGDVRTVVLGVPAQCCPKPGRPDSQACHPFLLPPCSEQMEGVGGSIVDLSVLRRDRPLCRVGFGIFKGQVQRPRKKKGLPLPDSFLVPRTCFL